MIIAVIIFPSAFFSSKSSKTGSDFVELPWTATVDDSCQVYMHTFSQFPEALDKAVTPAPL